MKALHRLVGNTPKRGFGTGLFSPGFPGGFAILAHTDIRLPMTGVPGERDAQLPSVPAEAYRAFEVQPLRYGLVAAFQSVKINIQGSRPSSYTDTVIPAGEEVKENVTAGPGIRSILRFHGFLSSDAFLGLSRNVLDVTEWTCLDESVLDSYALPAAVTPAMHRALLCHYWRAATVQRFGPWDARTGQCAYEAHPVMREQLPLRYTVILCLGPEADCGRIIDMARGFLWKAVLRLLPAPVSNIASMSAAAPVRFVSSIYRDTALAIVYPEKHDSIQFDFRTGAGPEITPAEDAFMQKILRGERPALLSSLVRRYREMTGAADENDISFLADYDVAWQLELLGKEDLPFRERIKSWYALEKYLEDRHGLSREQADRLCADVDRDVLERLARESGEISAALAPREEERHNRANALLLSFLWRKALDAEDGQFGPISSLLTAYHTPGAEHFFLENLLAASIESPLEEKRAAEMTDRILRAHFMTERPFSARQIECLRSDALMALCRAHPPVREALCAFLEEESRKNPHNMLNLLPVTVRLLPRDALMARLFTYLEQTQLERLPDQAFWPGLRAGMTGLDTASSAHSAYAAYMTACFARHAQEVQPVCDLGCAVNADAEKSLCGMLEKAAREGILLSPAQTARLMGEDPRKNLYPLCAQKQPVAQAFRAYLAAMTLGREAWAEDLSQWMLQTYQAGGACLRDTAPAENVKSGMEEMFIRYLVQRGKALRCVPGEAAFRQMAGLAVPQRHAAFDKHSAGVLEMYEIVLAQGNDAQRAEAARQLHTLLPGFASTRGYPEILRLEQRFICEKLKESWKNHEYWQGLEGVKEDLRRSQLFPNQLLTRDVIQAGQARLDADLSPLTAYQQFYARYNEYKARAGSQFPPKAEEPSFSQLCFERMQAHFTARFDSQVAQCGDWNELLQLQSYAETVMRLAAGIQDADGDRSIRAVRSVQLTLDSLSDGDEIGVMLQKAMRCAKTLSESSLVSADCYHHALELLQAYYLVARRAEMNGRAFHTRLTIGLVCSISPERKVIRWRDVISQLCPGYEGMMRSPFSDGDIPLFQTIHFMFAALANQREDDGTPSLKWAGSLARFLNGDGEFAAYSARVRREKRALRRYLPYLQDPRPESQALNLWLGTDA